MIYQKHLDDQHAINAAWRDLLAMLAEVDRNTPPFQPQKDPPMARAPKTTATKRRPKALGTAFDPGEGQFAASQEVAAAINDGSAETPWAAERRQAAEAQLAVTILSAQLGFLRNQLDKVTQRYMGALVENQRCTFDEAAQRLQQERVFAEQTLQGIASSLTPETPAS